MDRLVALVFSGVTEGAVTALAAVGLLVLYKATRIINFAHGDLITLGAFVDVWLVTDHGWHYVTGTVAAMAVMVVVGVAMERIAVAPLRGQSIHVVVIATLGLGLAIRTLIANWQGNDPKRLPSPVQGRNSELLGASINHHRVLVIVVGGLCLAGAFWFFARTRYGRQLRAVAADRDMAQLAGVRVSALSMGAFGVAAALAGLCGMLLAPLSSAQLGLGFAVMLNAFAAMIIGGFGSIGGVVLAGLLIGLVERVVGGYMVPSFASALPFLVMIGAIALRPEGLFGATQEATRH